MSSARANLAAATPSLRGLSVGDAFGECFFTIATSELSLGFHLSTRTLPNLRWTWTDDTAMAVCIVEQLAEIGHIQQDNLASRFAQRYAFEESRGYGATARRILRLIHEGQPWQAVSAQVMGGMGSMGNGGAMRAAPLGAFFADTEAAIIVEQARLSAEVTHAHIEGQAGAVAVALAAAFVASAARFHRVGFFDFILAHTPDSETRAKIAQASALPASFAVETAASVLGSGLQLTSQDTVPFCLWSVARNPDDFESALWATVSTSGDRDTNCAIVAGILAANPRLSLPAEWLAKAEPLPSLTKDS